MVCFQPLKGYRARYINPETKKRPIVFSPSQGYSDIPVIVPCGKCIGCLMTRSYHWAVRCSCEVPYHSESWFLTLTYDKKNLPPDGELCRADFQSFMKRLRWHYRDYKLKVFYCGEYGTKRHRPHYHAIVFGLPLESSGAVLVPVGTSRRGNVNYSCAKISKIWGLGKIAIGTCTPESCCYVAQYTAKKHDYKMQRYVATRQIKPFIGASNRQSLGYSFFMEYYRDIYRRGFFCPFPDRQRLVRPIPYFNKLLEKVDKVLYYTAVELPRRRYIGSLMRRAQSPGEFRNSLLDRDAKEMYYRERKALRNIQERADL